MEIRRIRSVFSAAAGVIHEWPGCNNHERRRAHRAGLETATPRAAAGTLTT